jgi:hypothetical protein
MAETIEQALTRLGFCILTGTTPETLTTCIGLVVRRMWDFEIAPLPDFSRLTSITAESLLPFNDAPAGYLWLLNIYLRGKEVLFEIGICPRAKIASLETLDPDHFLSPARFAAWEAKQTVERRRTTVGIALRDFCKRKDAEPDKPYGKANGVHLAYILGKDSGNHVSVMTAAEKRMYYFNDSPAYYNLCQSKHHAEYCSMTPAQFAATTSVLEAIARRLATRESGHIRTALGWMENPSASTSLSSHSRFGGSSSSSRFGESSSSSRFGGAGSSSRFGRPGSSSRFGGSSSSGRPSIDSASWRS